MTEYEMRSRPLIKGLAPRMRSMNTLVSTRTSVTLLRFCPDVTTPFASGNFEVRGDTEEPFEVRLEVDLPTLVLEEVLVDGVADELREGLALALPQLVEALALLLGQVDLGSSAGHG